MIPALIIAFSLGACAGSFIGVVIHRLPRGLSIVTPPSRCGACGTHLAWFENVPILGWLLLGGRCRHCGTAIPVSCLWLEVAVAGITALVAWGALTRPQLWSPALIDLTHGGFWLAQGVTLAVLLPVVWLLVAACVIDWELMIIPDEITNALQIIAIPAAVLVGTSQVWSPASDHPWALKWWLQHWDRFDGMLATPGTAALRLGLVAGIGCAAILASMPLATRIYARFDRERWSDLDNRALRLGGAWFCAWLALWTAAAIALLLLLPPGTIETESQPNPWFRIHVAVLHAVLGSLLGWMLPWLIGLGGTAWFKRSAMGYADVKLLGALGAFLGPEGLIAAFVFATVIGTVIGIPARFLGGGKQMPFGPSLAAGAVAAVAAGPWLAPVAWRTFRVLA